MPEGGGAAAREIHIRVPLFAWDFRHLRLLRGVQQQVCLTMRPHRNVALAVLLGSLQCSVAVLRQMQAPMAPLMAPPMAAPPAPAPAPAPGAPAAAAAVSAAMDSFEDAAKEAGAKLNVAETTVNGHMSEIEGMLDGLDYWSVRTPHLKGAVRNYINAAPGDLGGYRNNMAAFRAVLTTPAPPAPPAGLVPPPANLPPPAF